MAISVTMVVVEQCFSFQLVLNRRPPRKGLAWGYLDWLDCEPEDDVTSGVQTLSKFPQVARSQPGLHNPQIHGRKAFLRMIAYIHPKLMIPEG